MVKKPDFEKARNYVLDRLKNEISSNLTYHNLGHTESEVVPAAERMAITEKVNDEDHLLLLTGAYYHDLGFIRQRQDHESISIQLAEQSLPGFGYSDAQVAVVVGIIKATRLPQSPTTLLEKIMADADMDDLGHENFWKRSSDLRRELENYGTKYSDEEWYTYQLQLLQTHKYFTNSERVLRNTAKEQHIVELGRLLEEAKQRK
ncbi:MAG: HD domain-containing protein [Anaerolineaceae bacterium]|nr:HD domain-containing protein [Anaerolineaceae bacterium]